jgi:hypothetical protein
MELHSNSSEPNTSILFLIFIALVALTLLMARDFYSQVTAHQQLRAVNARAFQQSQETQRISTALQGVSADLLNLAKTSSTAQKIIDDFGIKKNAPPEHKK